MLDTVLLMRDVFRVAVTKACTGCGLLFILWLSALSKGDVCSLVVEIEDPGSHSMLQ